MYYSSYEIVREQNIATRRMRAIRTRAKRHKNSMPQLWRRWRRRHRRQQHHQRKQWNEKLKQTPEDDENIYVYMWRQKFLRCCWSVVSTLSLQLLLRSASAFIFIYYFSLTIVWAFGIPVASPASTATPHRSTLNTEYGENCPTSNAWRWGERERERESEISGGCVAAQRTSIHLDK